MVPGAPKQQDGEELLVSVRSTAHEPHVLGLLGPRPQLNNVVAREVLRFVHYEPR